MGPKSLVTRFIFFSMVGMSLLSFELFIPEKIAAMLNKAKSGKENNSHLFVLYIGLVLSTIVRESAVRYFRNYQNVQLADA